jgi:hypothetical protein
MAPPEKPVAVAAEVPSKKCLSVRFMSSLVIGAQQLSQVLDGREFALSVLNNGVRVKQLTGQNKTFLVPFGNCASIELAE